MNRIGGKSNVAKAVRIPARSAPLRLWMQVGTRPAADGFGACATETRPAQRIKADRPPAAYGVTPAYLRSGRQA